MAGAHLLAMKLHFKYRLLLPLLALGLAASLSAIGSSQNKSFMEQQQALAVWDYIPPAEVLLHSVNYPAAFAASMIGGEHTLRIGIEYSSKSFFIYLLCIVMLWYVIGYLMDTRSRVFVRSKWSTTAAVLIILYGGSLVLLAVSSWVVYPVIVGVSGVLWGAIAILIS